MLDCIKALLKRGKRSNRFSGKGKNSPWRLDQKEFFKSHTNAGKLYVVENFRKKQAKIKFPK